MEYSAIKKAALRYGEELERNPAGLADLALLAARFPELSALNLFALHLQCPNAIALRTANDWMIDKSQIRIGQKVIHLFEKTTKSFLQRGKETVPLSEATPEESYQLKNGAISTITKVVPFPHSFFDLTQTKTPREDYPKYEKKPPLAMLSAVQQWQSLLLFAGDMDFQVKLVSFSSPMMQSRYEPEGNRIEISSALPENQRTAPFLHALATGILLRTSTEETVPAIRDFETEALYAGLSHQCGLPLEVDFKENLRAVARKIPQEDFDFTQTFSRIGKAQTYTVNGISESYRSYLQESNLRENTLPTQTPEQEKIKANFLQEL